MDGKNLMDFGVEHHFSSWCRDYVYNMSVAITRRPVIAIVASAIAMGLWHDASI